MRSNAELIKERLGIAEVVGSYIKLEKAGGSFRARCPFHNEKTPSFYVSPTRNSFYCFGCEAKGDIFSFVERYEGVDFKGALKILAERAGIELVREDPKERDEREELFRVMEEATAYYRANLLAHEAPRAYLAKRGLSDASMESFRIGYALPEWRGLTEYLVGKGYPEALVEKAGLAKRASEGGDRLYDRFRGRIMFPLMDTSGRVIAFSGRIFDIPQGVKEEPAKYINSPETPLFSKSKVLYGFDKAKEGIRKWSFTILVEGQMDMVMSHQAGYRNAVALSGTALTDEHVDQLLRLSDRLVLALDTDKAGVAAAGRSATLALRRGLDVKVALLSQGKDPADLIAADPDLWKEAVKSAVHIVDYYLKIVLEKEPDERKRRLAVSATVLPYIALIAKPMDRAHFTARAASAVRLPEEAVRQEVEGLRSAPAALAPAVARAEEALRPRREVLLHTLASILWWLEARPEGVAQAEDLRTRLAALAPEALALGEDENLKNRLVFQAELLYAQVADLGQVISDLLLRLERESLRQIIDKLRFELTESERAGTTERTASLLEESRATARKLSEIDARLQS